MTAAESPRDARERDLLQKARTGLGPSDQEQAALFAAVAARTALPSEGTSDGASEQPFVRPRPDDAATSASSGSLPVSSRASGSLLLGTAGGLLVGFGLGLWAAPSLQELMHPAPTPRVVQTTPPGLAEAARSPDPPAAVDLIGLVPEAAPPAPGTPTRSPSSTPLPPAESAPAATFYDELDHVRRAQAALKNDNPALALGLLTTLGERHPEGALLTERGVIEVLALCKLGQDDRARSVAARVRSSQPGGVYEARLRASCIGGESEPSDGKRDRATSTRELEPEDTK